LWSVDFSPVFRSTSTTDPNWCRRCKWQYLYRWTTKR
jgi:hypothetical protein